MNSTGYYSGIPYPAMFHREMTPLWLATALEALGFRPPDISGGFTWCELGCGPGLDLAIAAAANPGGRFLGVDADPAHVAAARHLVRRAGLRNVEFHLADFAAWAERAELPACDFIVLHGVFAWISPDRQEAVLKIVERSLEPGGVCYLGYMSHPGASPMMSLQQIMARYGGDDAARGMARGFHMLEALARGGAGQFAEVPGLQAQLARLRELPPGYLAHELLGRHWRPLHSAEAIQAMRAVGCDYLGSAAPIENIDAVSLPEGAQAPIASIDDVPLREVAKDIARNQSQRLDLYQRGKQTLTATEHRLALSRQSWLRLPAAPASGAIRLETRIGPVEGAEAVFSPLLERLASGPQDFADLLALETFKGNGGLLNQALQMMLWAGWAHPLRAGEDADAVAACQALNREICRDRLLGHAADTLAVAGIGSGLRASRLEMAYYLTLAESPELSASALHEAVRRRLPDAADADMAEVEQRALPEWRRLGLLPDI
ncbi:MAG: class I SAM-dependent methyltransferase [Zoogloeaceae bacterium]|nr:class I SAM-dependent methyltransferase [Zoogloeaceae bacterium]